MSTPESIYVRLNFHPDSSNQERDSDHAYLFEKLSELIQETSAFESYRVLTDEDHPFTPGDKAALDQAQCIASLKAANGGHWGEHPEHGLSEWRAEVEEDSTRLGYWEWVDARICDAEEDQ